MIGKWIDLVILVFLALGLLKGFKRGLVRELFSLLGAILAIIIAYHSYQTVALRLLEHYALSTWQAQALSFVVLLVGISLLGVFFGYVWSKALSYTPFSVLDHIGGAAFGAAKVGAVVLILLLFLGAANISFIDTLLDESVVVEQIGVLLPFVYDYLDQYWPEQLPRPLWLYPPQDPGAVAGFSWAF
ncbi:MAG: CvpA family protein [Bacillota bacterium]|jgi:membrane protein required for colicin V production|nr:CvpA family protein [Bacillota bacterium]NLJ02782.1 CvpA family protein [Bacillota bacterium]